MGLPHRAVEDQRNYVYKDALRILNSILLESIAQCWVWLAWGLVLIDKKEQHSYPTLLARCSCPLVARTLADWENDRVQTRDGKMRGSTGMILGTLVQPHSRQTLVLVLVTCVLIQEQMMNSHCHQVPPPMGGGIGIGGDWELFQTSWIKWPSLNISKPQFPQSPPLRSL